LSIDVALPKETDMDDKVPNVLSYSIKGLCLATGWSRARVYQMINAGELVALKDGKRTIIPAESARRRIESLPAYTPKPAA
jgi:hypothetical protein